MMATTGMSMKTRTALLVSTAVLLTSLILLNCAPCVAAVQPFPVELDGFVGQLMGTVVVAPNPGGLSIKVTKVTPASESKIKDASVLVGAEYWVTVPYVRDDSGKWVPLPPCWTAMQTIHAGDSVSCPVMTITGKDDKPNLSMARAPEKFDDTPTVALNLLTHAGSLVCVAPAGDGKQALVLAAQPGVLVYALETDSAKVDAIRTNAAKAGLLGRSLYVEQGEVLHLPFADNLIDLVIASKDVPESEIMRVLSPVTGRAIIGGKVLTKPAFAGADDWTHRFHGSDNNPAANDTVFHLPAMLQYIALPMLNSNEGITLAAGSRRVELSDWVLKAPDRDAIAGKIRVRSLYNGQILWQRELPKDIDPDSPICTLDTDHIYLASTDSCAVRVLEMETGKELTPITFAGNDALRAKWIAVEGNRLYVLLGAPLPGRGAYSFYAANVDARQPGAVGNIIVADDLKTGQEVWHHEEPGTIDYRTIAVRTGRTYLFSYGDKNRLVCLDADGKLLWENNEVATQKRSLKWTDPNWGSSSTLIVGPSGQMQLSIPGDPAVKFFDTRDGHLLWSNFMWGPKRYFVGDLFYGVSDAFEAATGIKVGANNMLGSGCGVATWASGLSEGVGHVALGVKSPCGVPTFVAGGVLNFTPSHCACWPYYRGAVGYMATGELLQQHLLESGHASAATVKAAAGDWTQYRGDTRRTGGTVASAGTAMKVRAIATMEQVFPVPTGYNGQRMEWLDRPTPPVTAGGFAFYGASDGSLRAVKLATGKPAWTFWTGGAVLTSPAFASGRLYAGSGDGWVYCLDAATGQLVWRWRGAPADRRIMVYGKLMNTWPVLAVLINDGVVYGVAGQWMQHGETTFALDAATGKQLWVHWTEPYNNPFNNLMRNDSGFSPSGQLALVGSRLWVRAYLGVPVIFDTATGERIPDSLTLQSFQARQAWSFGGWLATSGQDILVVNDKLVLQGGRPILENPDMRNTGPVKFIAYKVNDDGTVSGLPQPSEGIPNSIVAPALAGEDLALVGGGARKYQPTQGLNLFELTKWREQLPALGPPSNYKGDAVNIGGPAKEELDMSQARWRAANLDVNAVVLAADAVVVAVGESRTTAPLPFGARPQFNGWKLQALDRVTGKLIWNVELPCEPVLNGIAPAADGSWVATLRDGSIAVVMIDN